jgi:hypothetical protein
MTRFTHAIAHNAVNTLVVRPSGTPAPTIEILHADD